MMQHEVIEAVFLMEEIDKEFSEFFLDQQFIKPFADRHKVKVVNIGRAFLTDKDYKSYFCLD